MNDHSNATSPAKVLEKMCKTVQKKSKCEMCQMENQNAQEKGIDEEKWEKGGNNKWKKTEIKTKTKTKQSTQRHANQTFSLFSVEKFVSLLLVLCRCGFLLAFFCACFSYLSSFKKKVDWPIFWHFFRYDLAMWYLSFAFCLS